MTEKLTAKLSDGTEWEVVNNMPTAEGSKNRVMWMKPLKKEPREWWQIQSAVDRGFLCATRFESEAEAKMGAKIRNESAGSNAYFVVYVREVVE